MLFGAFFMFMGTGALVSLVTNFSSYILEMAEWEAWDPRKFQNDLIQLRDSMGEGHGISELDFMTFTLVQKGILSKEQVEAVKQTYHSMKLGSGDVTIKSVALHVGIDQSEEPEMGQLGPPKK